MILKYLGRCIGRVWVLMYYLLLLFVKARNKCPRRQSCKKWYELEMPDTNLIPVGHSITIKSLIKEPQRVL